MKNSDSSTAAADKHSNAMNQETNTNIQINATTSANISSENNLKPSTLPNTLRPRIKKCNIYTRKSKIPNVGKGFALAEGILQKNVAIHHQCTDEPKCLQKLTKQIAIGDLTSTEIHPLTDLKFSEKWDILMST